MRNSSQYEGPSTGTLKAVAAAAAATTMTDVKTPEPPQFDDFNNSSTGDVDAKSSNSVNQQAPSILDRRPSPSASANPNPNPVTLAKLGSEAGAGLAGQEGLHALNSKASKTLSSTLKQSQPQVDPTEAKIAELLKNNEPDRLVVLKKLMRKFKDKEDELLERLQKRYAKKKKQRAMGAQEEKKVEAKEDKKTEPSSNIELQLTSASAQSTTVHPGPPASDMRMNLASASQQHDSAFRSSGFTGPDGARQSSRTSTDQTAPGDREDPNVAPTSRRPVATGDRNTSESTAHTEPTTDSSLNNNGAVDARPQVSVLKVRRSESRRLRPLTSLILLFARHLSPSSRHSHFVSSKARSLVRPRVLVAPGAVDTGATPRRQGAVSAVRRLSSPELEPGL